MIPTTTVRRAPVPAPKSAPRPATTTDDDEPRRDGRVGPSPEADGPEEDERDERTPYDEPDEDDEPDDGDD